MSLYRGYLGLFAILGACATGADPFLGDATSTAGPEPSADGGAAEDAGDEEPGPGGADGGDAEPAPETDAETPETDAAEPGPIDGGTLDAGPPGPRPDAGSDAGGQGAEAGADGGHTQPEQSPFPYPPSNVDPNTIDWAAVPSATLNCGTTEIDTSGSISLRNWCGSAPAPVVKTQAGGGEVALIALRGLTLEQSATLRIVGARPIVFLVHGAVTLRGTLDASARQGTPGPGGNAMCGTSSGGNGAGESGDEGTGGGGGGFGTKGGDGGQSGNVMVGVGGSARGNAELTPLLGGCGGGRGGGCAGVAGAGGGAVQISASAALAVSGDLRAVGGDGADGCGNDAGGTGAGSGGGILLEGATLDVNRERISAAGGRGGDGQAGGDGGEGASTAANPGGRGENGGGSGGGGGGGGHGRVRLRALGTCTGC